MLKSKLVSIFGNKCPRCHKGKFWPLGPYENLLRNSGRMYDRCSYCGLKYFPEIGFYYGAMYISYVLGALIFIVSWGLVELLTNDISTWAVIIIVCAAILILAPVNYFLSRLIWINIVVHFDPKIAKQDSVHARPRMVNKT